MQIALFKALGATLPGFAHHNLLVAADGEALSKRSGALALQDLRERGLEPMAVAALAVLLASEAGAGITGATLIVDGGTAPY